MVPFFVCVCVCVPFYPIFFSLLCSPSPALPFFFVSHLRSRPDGSLVLFPSVRERWMDGVCAPRPWQEVVDNPRCLIIMFNFGPVPCFFVAIFSSGSAVDLPRGATCLWMCVCILLYKY